MIPYFYRWLKAKLNPITRYRYEIVPVLRARINKIRRMVEKSHSNKVAKHFQKIKDKHKGQRGFVIGNGPSLQLSDLEKLQGEITIATNKIFKAFDSLKWRPTYYVVTSPLQTQLYGSEFRKYFERVYTRSDLSANIKKCIVYGWTPLGSTQGCDPSTMRFSSNVEEGAYCGASVTFEALQFAMHLGLNPIYLIGCDHQYNDQPDKPQHNQLLLAGSCNDHFIPDYRLPDEPINPFVEETITNSFLHAHKYALSHGIRIINATRGGALEVFERVSFDSLV